MGNGERLKEIRKAMNMTAEKFSERLGVSRVAITNIENGKREITNQMERALVREYKVNPEWLRTGEGDMFLKMERMEEIAFFLGSIPDDDCFKARIISALAKLDEKGWQALEEILDQIIEEIKKD